VSRGGGKKKGGKTQPLHPFPSNSTTRKKGKQEESAFKNKKNQTHSLLHTASSFSVYSLICVVFSCGRSHTLNPAFLMLSSCRCIVHNPPPIIHSPLPLSSSHTLIPFRIVLQSCQTNSLFPEPCWWKGAMWACMHACVYAGCGHIPFFSLSFTLSTQLSALVSLSSLFSSSSPFLSLSRLSPLFPQFSDHPFGFCFASFNSSRIFFSIEF